MEKIYRAAKYIRTSCPDDELQYRDSVANQRRLIDAFIKSHPEIVVVTEMIDEGYSGLFVERPAFKELLADVEAGVVNCVIVKDLSRLNRDYIETGRYLRDYFPAHDVRFISVDDNIDSIRLDEFDKMIALLKSIFSEQYSRDVSVKTRSSLAMKRRQGKYVGAIPIYGYQKSVDNKHQLIPDLNTADVVRSIYQMKLIGMSAASIASALNESDVPSPISYKREYGLPYATGGFADKKDALWSVTTVLRILRDENYTGTLVQGRQSSLNYKTKVLLNLAESEWVKTKNAHPAIISRADFETVQRTLAIDTRTSPKHGIVHIFSGILVCGCCDGNMTRKTVRYKGRAYIYYYCPTGKKNGCVSSETISETKLLNIVTHKVRERIADIQRLGSCIPKSQIAELMRNECIQRSTTCDMESRDLHRYKLHLHKCKTEGLINDVEYQEFQDYYDSEIFRLDTELTHLCGKLCCTDVLDENNFEWEQRFLQFANMEKLDRLAVIKMILNIHVQNEKNVNINFVHQIEYEQLVRYSELGGLHLWRERAEK